MRLAQAHPLIAAAREGRLGDFHANSPFAACLLPLLESLGWRGNLKEVMEAIPHLPDYFDLVDLRNVLAELGYQTRPEPGRMGRVDHRFLPALFVPDQGAPVVLRTAGSEGGTVVFDPLDGQDFVLYRPGPEGTIYLVEPDDSEEGGETRRRDWTHQLLVRFRNMAIGMAGISFVLSFLALAPPLFILAVYDYVVPSRASNILYEMLVGLGLVVAVELALRHVRGKAIAFVGARIEALISNATWRQILYLPTNYTEQASISGQIARIKEFRSVRDFFSGPLATAILELPFILVALTVTALLAGWMVVVPIVAGLGYVLTGVIMTPWLSTAGAAARQARARRQNFLVEMMLNLRSLRQLGLEDVWLARYEPLSVNAATSQHRVAQLNNTMGTISHALMTAAGAGTLAMGALAVIDGTLTAGGLIATMALVWRTLSPLQMALTALQQTSQIKSTLAHIDQLMRLTNEVDQHAQPRERLVRRQFEGHVRLTRVSIRYRQEAEPALLAVSMEVQPRQLVVLTGPSGSGKSTVLKMIAGLYRPQAGVVLLDRLDIRQIPVGELREAVSYMPQNCDLFYGTIAQNLRLAAPAASDAALAEVAARTGLADDLEILPRGIDTRIGDQSMGRMPAGFRQRLGLARAYLKDSPVLLLDEPANGMDAASDALFIESVKHYKGTKTIVLVTHRPSHMRLADRVVALDGGRVTMDGAPDEVIPRLMGRPKEKKKA